MHIDKVTISGADNDTDPIMMLALQRVYPFVEWGILFSQDRLGSPRYPDLGWINNLPEELNISLHLCGKYCRRYVSHPDESILNWINKGRFQRVQLNHIFNAGDEYTNALNAINKAASDLPDGKKIILPYNKGSKHHLDSFMDRVAVSSNINFLYDSSGGRGTMIDKFQSPFRNYTGYAGGISPENVSTVCDVLKFMAPDKSVWIDMESGVRTVNVFDLKKVKLVLEAAKKIITQKVGAQ